MKISIKQLAKILFMLLTMSALTMCHNHDHSHGDHKHSHDDSDHTHAAENGGHGHTHGAGGHTHDHTVEKGKSIFTYLNMNGEFKMNLNDSTTQNDPRNPSRLKLQTSDEAGTVTKMAFYDHDDMEKLLASCGYEFIGSRPDPHYYPAESKTSIWDVFKKVEDYDGDCSQFEYVISRSPHGDPIHMHLRYGDDVEALLAMSNDEEDENFNPWWSTYCDIERSTSCN